MNMEIGVGVTCSVHMLVSALVSFACQVALHLKKDGAWMVLFFHLLAFLCLIIHEMRQCNELGSLERKEGLQQNLYLDME